MVSVSGKERKTNAEKCRTWRESQGSTLKAKECARKRCDRATRTEQQIARDKCKAKERMKLRERRKEATEKNLEPVATPVLTRKRVEERWEKWRLYKQRHRGKIGPQKKRRIREKDRARKSMARGSTMTSSSPSEKVQTTSNAAERQAVSRMRRKLPSNPQRYAAVMKGLLKTTPRKRKAVSTFMLTPSKVRRLEFLEKTVRSVGSTLKSLRAKDKETVKRRRILTSTIGQQSDAMQGFLWLFFLLRHTIDQVNFF